MANETYYKFLKNKELQNINVNIINSTVIVKNKMLNVKLKYNYLGCL